MFQGASELVLDAKGRLAVPTRYREALLSGGGPLVLTAHPDECLLLYPMQAWEPVVSRIQSLSSFDPSSRWWQRLLVGHAEEVEMDGSGRILISPALRSFARLEKNCMLIGQVNRFELWDLARWKSGLGGALPRTGSAAPPGTENFSL